jgi:hypothetical protein
MNEAVGNVVSKEMSLRLGRTPVRPRSSERGDERPIPARAPGGFVVDLLEETGPMSHVSILQDPSPAPWTDEMEPVHTGRVPDDRIALGAHHAVVPFPDHVRGIRGDPLFIGSLGNYSAKREPRLEIPI